LDAEPIDRALREGRPHEARRLVERWLERAPEDAEAWNLLGRVEATLGDRAAAQVAFTRAVSIQPTHDRAAANLAKLHGDAGELERARAVLEAAVAVSPGSTRLARALGLTLVKLGCFDEAIAPLEVALGAPVDPVVERALVEALDEAAYAADRARRLDRSAARLRRLVELRPSEPSYARRLATMLVSLRRVPDALSVLELRDLDREPTLRSTWLQLRHYLPAWSREDARRAHERYGDIVRGGRLGAAPAPRPGRASGRLRVGYYSRDLRKHAVAWFLRPILRHHDRTRFEVVLLSDVTRPDDVSATLASLADRSVDVSALDQGGLRDRILGEKLDVLVELGGHTAFERLPVFAEKLAPLQLGYLGYPDRTGLASYDGRIVDAVTDPPGVDESEREPLLRLDVCAWSFEPGCEALPTERPPRTEVVLGSYNYLGKLTDELARAWGRILSRVPRARLRLKSAAFASPEVRDQQRSELAALGVDPERLDLAPHTPTREAHLASYRDLDLALDTSPYNGTTTTCEALWMGTPVLTLAGETHVARVGASMLRALGRPELVASSLDDYVERAVTLAHRPDELAGLHRGLRDELLASPLGQGARLTAALESLYQRGHGRP
jgi:predicted O-linked N-acetylglucosamine transferase (SPINDLY family)